MSNSYSIDACFPSTLPGPHRHFIMRVLQTIPSDSRFVGLAAAGSFLTNKMDDFSDVDLIIVTKSEQQHKVMRDRYNIASGLGNLLSAFSGEHVGEPRLYICLYDDPLLHVDLKFVSLADVHLRVEQPIVLWERDRKVTAALSKTQAHYPEVDIEWIEARFWTWMHYGAGKIGRGELFEAIDMITYLRSSVLGPLALHRVGARPQGVRKLEIHDAAFVAALRATVPLYDAVDCLRALKACLLLYRELRDSFPKVTANRVAERALEQYLHKIRSYIEVMNAS